MKICRPPYRIGNPPGWDYRVMQYYPVWDSASKCNKIVRVFYDKNKAPIKYEDVPLNDWPTRDSLNAILTSVTGAFRRATLDEQLHEVTS